MSLDASTFEYHQPNDAQVAVMDELRAAAAEYAQAINLAVPDGPDKTFILRSLRTVAMWVNVAITREDNGAPRTHA